MDDHHVTGALKRQLSSNPISLRDHFAGLAMAQMLAEFLPRVSAVGSSVEATAIAEKYFKNLPGGAYEIADSMLAARDGVSS